MGVGRRRAGPRAVFSRPAPAPARVCLAPMAPLHVVVATDRFRVGGRETFVATALRALRPHGSSASLLCSDLERGLPEARVFERVAVCPPQPQVAGLRDWLERGAELLGAAQPALIWAQHFDLLQAWLLSRRWRVPLLVTFHGPLVGAGRPNGLLQALGMTLAIHRGDALTGVSREVLDGLVSLRGDGRLHLTRNLVELPAAAAAPAAWPPRRLLLVARDEKLEHLRACVRLFAAHRRRVGGARLALVTGAGGRVHGTLARARHGLRVLGARWCRAQGPALLRALPFVDWHGYEPEPRRLMRASDLVLGMGRVLIEALAERRPAYLVGYTGLHGLLTPATLDACAAANFSGRGLPAHSDAEAADQLRDARPPDAPSVAAFDARAGAAPLDALLRATTLCATPADFELAEQALRSLEHEGRPEALFGLLAGALDARERESLYRLAAG